MPAPLTALYNDRGVARRVIVFVLKSLPGPGAGGGGAEYMAAGVWWCIPVEGASLGLRRSKKLLERLLPLSLLCVPTSTGTGDSKGMVNSAVL